MVPNGWSATQFGDLADFKSGGTPSKQNTNYWGGDEPWISGKDLKSHYLSTSIDRLTIEGFSIAKKTPLGSTLILVRGMTLLKDFPVGYTTKEVAFNQDIKALLAKSNIDGLFLSFLLVGNKHKIKNLVTTAGHGTGRLDTESLKAFPVDLPPLPEQRKIAKILIAWDRGIATTEKLIDASKQQKKALMQQLLTGKKRLRSSPKNGAETGKAFEGEWKKVELGKLLDYKQPTPFLVKSTEYSNDYPTPVLTAGKTFILGYSNEDFGIFNEELPAIIFDDFTTASKFVDFPFKAKSSAMKILVAKDGVSIKYVYEAMQILNYPVGGHQRHWISIFANLVIGVPEPDEQQKIASVLTAADKEIELLQTKLTHFKQEKKALMQQLLTGKRRVKVEKLLLERTC